ncbi:hypothetical protein [Ferruginibacter sp.]
MKKIFAIILLFFCWGSGQAQLFRIVRAYAFFSVSVPGMQRVDDRGNPVNPDPIIDRVIYIECRFNGRPKIDSVLYNGVLYAATVADKEENVLSIGTRQDNGKAIVLPRSKGNHIWRIDVSQLEGKPLLHEQLKKIVLKGKLNSNKFAFTLISETQLSTPDRP